MLNILLNIFLKNFGCDLDEFLARFVPQDTADSHADALWFVGEKLEKFSEATIKNMVAEIEARGEPDNVQFGYHISMTFGMTELLFAPVIEERLCEDAANELATRQSEQGDES